VNKEKSNSRVSTSRRAMLIGGSAAGGCGWANLCTRYSPSFRPRGIEKDFAPTACIWGLLAFTGSSERSLEMRPETKYKGRDQCNGPASYTSVSRLRAVRLFEVRTD
jgi:hypothetical protein